MSAKQKKKSKSIKYLLVGVAGVCMYLLYIIYSNVYSSPAAFGIHIPKPYTICGIDVSRYQEKIDWLKLSKARSGKDSFAVHFAFIKATEGKSLADPCFKYNWDNSKKHQIIRGAYHYYKPNINSKLQADNFVANVKLEKGDLPPVLDIEETGRLGDDNMKQGIKNWLILIERHYGVKPIIYCYVDFYERFLNEEAFKSYPFWIAHYYKKELRVKEKWYFWQHSDRGYVDGIRTKVDFNVFNGTIDDLHALCK